MRTKNRTQRRKFRENLWRSAAVIVMVFLLSTSVSQNAAATVSNSKHGFGLSTNKAHVVPGNGEAKIFPKRRAFYFVKTNKKRLYLTFDCGYENGNTKKILDILKKQDVKALFFVTKTYIRDNPGLVKRMKREGHMVGNHTCTHPSMPSCSVKQIQKEIRVCASYMKKKTGYSMDKYLRPPKGEWSSRTLKITKDMGYTSVFWSMAFYDYDVEKQPGKDTIYRQFMEHYHKGAIPLFHVISKSDTEALPDIIRDMKKKGYKFRTLTDLEPEREKMLGAELETKKKEIKKSCRR